MNSQTDFRPFKLSGSFEGSSYIDQKPLRTLLLSWLLTVYRTTLDVSTLLSWGYGDIEEGSTLEPRSEPSLSVSKTFQSHETTLSEALDQVALENSQTTTSGLKTILLWDGVFINGNKEKENARKVSGSE